MCVLKHFWRKASYLSVVFLNIFGERHRLGPMTGLNEAAQFGMASGWSRTHKGGLYAQISGDHAVSQQHPLRREEV